MNMHELLACICHVARISATFKTQDDCHGRAVLCFHLMADRCSRHASAVHMQRSKGQLPWDLM